MLTWSHCCNSEKVKKKLNRIFFDCFLCGQKADFGYGFCQYCFGALPWLDNDHSCQRCSLPNISGGLCKNCQLNRYGFSVCISALGYEWPVKFMISDIKSRYHKGYLRALTYGLFLRLEKHYNQKWPELILPAPIAWNKHLTRGYNQAQLIAASLSKATQITMSSQYLSTKAHAEQKQLKFKQRHKNLQGVFSLRRPLTVEHVAIVDDIVTTGATANALAKILTKAGAKRVDIWSLARTAER